MQWTTKTPTEPGLYMLDEPGGDGPGVVAIYQYDGLDGTRARVQFHGNDQDYDITVVAAESPGTRWLGPFTAEDVARGMAGRQTKQPAGG